jgi:hypothetical protein
LEELNAQLLAACQQDQQRQISGRPLRVGAAMQVEREHLLPLEEEGFDLAEVSFPRVDGLGRVKVRTNCYSVPLRPGTGVQAKVYPSSVELWHDGECVARHERCYSRQQEILDLEHYLEVLERKPGALAGSKPLEQWRKAGRWPDSYDRFWEQLQARHGRQEGTRRMIELLALGKRQGSERLRGAVETALSLACWDVAAVRYLLTTEPPSRSPQEVLEVGRLSCYERPLPMMNEYDGLLSAEVAS